MCTTIWMTPKHDEEGGEQLAVEDTAHHQPERDSGQDYRQEKADQVAFQRAVAGLMAVAVAVMGRAHLRARAWS